MFAVWVRTMGRETQLLLIYCQDVVITTTTIATNISIIIGYDCLYYLYCSSFCSYFVGFIVVAITINIIIIVIVAGIINRYPDNCSETKTLYGPY